MPHRTFTEARRALSRANDPEKLKEEFDRKVAEATDRVRQHNAPQRQRLEGELAKLAKAAEANRDALKAAAEDRAKQRLAERDFVAKRDRLAQDQRVVMARAERVQARLASLAELEQNAPETLDRIASTTGLPQARTEFSF
jgi:hypothetical protein